MLEQSQADWFVLAHASRHVQEVSSDERFGLCWGTWLVPTLQFIEQGNMYNLYQNYGGSDTVSTNFPAPTPTGTTPPRYGAAPNTTNVTTKRIPTFTCPSDQPNAPLSNITSHNYAGVAGNGTSYASVAAGPAPVPAGYVARPGIFDPTIFEHVTPVANPPVKQTRRVNMGSVTDGLSNTLMVAEVLQGRGSDLRGFRMVVRSGCCQHLLWSEHRFA